MAKLFCLPFLILFLIFIQKDVLASSSIVINEIYANPVGGTVEEKVGEWVELYNNSSENIDINNWSLCDEANHQLIISSEFTKDSTIIDSKNFILVYRNSSTFSLNNSKETIFLFDSDNCSGQFIDSISY